MWDSGFFPFFCFSVYFHSAFDILGEPTINFVYYKCWALQVLVVVVFGSGRVLFGHLLSGVSNEWAIAQH